MITVSDLGFAYGETTVFEGLSFEVDADEILAVMGANGAGKTTLLKVLAGLREPDSGSVNASTDAPVGFAPDDPAAALFAETVAEEVAFFPRNRGLDVETATERALESLGIEHLADRQPRSLSVGEQRRVSIAAVLAGEPAAVVLDEPTAGLDLRSERQLGDRLRDITVPLVLSTHSADFAFTVADRVAILHQGQFEQIGEPQTVLTDEPFLEATGIRIPEIVSWSHRHGFDHYPANPNEAAGMIQRSQ